MGVQVVRIKHRLAAVAVVHPLCRRRRRLCLAKHRGRVKGQLAVQAGSVLCVLCMLRLVPLGVLVAEQRGGRGLVMAGCIVLLRGIQRAEVAQQATRLCRRIAVLAARMMPLQHLCPLC